eukprot:gb/GFBE01011539.1/.p1 GENE.gb/GFBE01011539.1/~~gb/GFBE01011539.1/.p1  ORF type:complete len:732 (+),score=136.08 gb/GFBE01011539.1/:1-2196(+)
MTADLPRSARNYEVQGEGSMREIKHRLDYAVELPCTEPETRHWRHVWCADRNGGELAKAPPIVPKGEPATIASCFDAATKSYSSRPCMGTRPITSCLLEGKKQYWTKGPFMWKTYGEVRNDVLAAARGFLALPGIKSIRDSGEECVVALLADTSAEWQIAALAALQCGLTITTVYTTLGNEAMLHGLNQTQASILFVDWAQYDVLSKKVIAECKALRHVVLIGRAFVPFETLGGETKAFPSTEEAMALPIIGEAATTTLESLIQVGGTDSTDLEPYKPRPDDVAIIMYTSGSTGLPKGVVLSHANFVANIAAAIAQEVVAPSAEDVFIAYLPLAHIFELVVEFLCLCQGAAIGYGHARTLTSSSPYIHPSNQSGSDLLALRPTVMVAVPAIQELIKTGLSNRLASLPGLRGKLARGAVNKVQGIPAGQGLIADCLLGLGLSAKTLKKVRAGLGLEKLKFLVSGGAPLSSETQKFVSAVLAPVAQGYGATEITGIASVQEVFACGGRPADRGSGHVGAVTPACEIKLLSVPDMGYYVNESPPRGEILIAGNNVAQSGYYKMPEKSAEDFIVHPDGKIWFHTGDIGTITETGCLKIIDRKKDLVKLSGGEYVSLGKVEAELKQVKGIGAVVAFARADKDHCVAVVSQPDKGWAFVGGKPQEEFLIKAMFEKLKGSGLQRFEIPTKVKVDDTVWSPENGLVTASLKVQRNPLRAYYNAPGGLLDQMDYRFPDAA